ncbi:MAG: hypothetical protein K0V04_18030 [Deltaproteobacteria bacterium]|nr:hypothetical protein [Deltaproteobacteria bacterium]
MEPGDTTADTGPGAEPSACVLDYSGSLQWSVATRSSERGLDVAVTNDGVLYVVDGCLSRWTESGERTWELLQPSWGCIAVALDLDGRPIVVGDAPSPEQGRISLVAALDHDATERWTVEVVPEPDAIRTASDVVVDPSGDVVVVGYHVPLVPALDWWVWASRYDIDGNEQWTVELPPGTSTFPFIGQDDDGNTIIAEQRRNEFGVSFVRFTNLDAKGSTVWTRSSLDSVGHPIRMDSFAVDGSGRIALAGRATDLQDDPPLLTLLEPDGSPRWIRTGMDVTWLETISAVEFDDCGGLIVAGKGDLEDKGWGQLWAAKLTLEADLRWSWLLPAPLESIDTNIQAVHVLPDGGAIISGVWIADEQPIEELEIPVPEAWLGRLAP